MAQALAEEGFGVSLDRGYPVEKPQELRAMTPCFSSTARSEVVWGDRKVVGSAQRRLRGAFLQHGSILVSRDHRKMVDCLNLDAEKRATLPGNPGSERRFPGRGLGRSLRWSDLAEGFENRFAAALGIDAEHTGLTPGEAARAEGLAADKSLEKPAPENARAGSARIVWD